MRDKGLRSSSSDRPSVTGVLPLPTDERGPKSYRLHLPSSEQVSAKVIGRMAWCCPSVSVDNLNARHAARGGSAANVARAAGDQSAPLLGAIT
jgi:hypothetical protein